MRSRTSRNVGHEQTETRSGACSNLDALLDIPPEVEVESRPCPLGCKPDDKEVLRGRDLLHNLPGEYAVVACNCCGLMRTNPRPTKRTIGLYYPEEYGPYREVPGAVSKASARKRGVSRTNVSKIFGSGGHKLPEQMPGRLLEIGCASGKFLQEMKSMGWRSYGIELSEFAASKAREAGLDVFTGSVESAPEPDYLYDLVVGWMVLEHLHDPVATLRRIRRWTRPEGWMAFSVPNSDCWSFKLFGRHWHELHLPNHLYHFNPAVLNKLLAEGGWNLHSVHYNPSLVGPVASLGNWLKAKGLFPNLALKLVNFPTRGSKWAYRIARPIAAVESLLHQSSRITVWARPVTNG